MRNKIFCLFGALFIFANLFANSYDFYHTTSLTRLFIHIVLFLPVAMIDVIMVAYMITMISEPKE